MSLLKALKVDRNYPKYKELQVNFIDVVDTVLDVPTKTDIIVLIRLYTDYSVKYLKEVAVTLEEPKGAQQTMKFMNSYIAECMTVAGLHYFHQEGHTIIDKAVQHALSNNGDLKYDVIESIIDDIEASYVEKTEEA